MAQTWDQKQTCPSPPCYKDAARQLWRHPTSHVPAVARHFPATEQTVFQTMEPILLSVCSPHFLTSVQWNVQTGSLQEGCPFPSCRFTNSQRDGPSAGISFGKPSVQSQYLARHKPHDSAPGLRWFGQRRESTLYGRLFGCCNFGQRLSAGKLGNHSNNVRKWFRS